MKRHSFAATFALAVVVFLGLTGLTVAGEQVTFKGSLEGDEETLVPPPSAVFHGIGGGQATQLGRFTYDFLATVEFVPPPPTGDGILTLTAANGDTIVAATLGSSQVIIPGELVLVTEEAIIFDGKGRFAGATGAFTIKRLKYQITGVTIGSFEGTISAPVNP
jgi:hypothetical protein